MKTFLLSIGLLACAGGVWAGEMLVTTFVADSGSSNGYPFSKTYTYNLPSNYAARVTTVIPSVLEPEAFFFTKGGYNFQASPGTLVQGPVTFTFVTEPGTDSDHFLVTLERWKISKLSNK